MVKAQSQRRVKRPIEIQGKRNIALIERTNHINQGVVEWDRFEDKKGDRLLDGRHCRGSYGGEFGKSQKDYVKTP